MLVVKHIVFRDMMLYGLK